VDKATKWLVQWRLQGAPKYLPAEELLAVPRGVFAHVDYLAWDQDGRRWAVVHDVALAMTERDLAIPWRKAPPGDLFKRYAKSVGKYSVNCGRRREYHDNIDYAREVARTCIERFRMEW
jgi:hypothetical protein